ncbi:Mg2+ transporter protein CorA-like/Zinc transport protein ZntB [Penicillium cf. griseofulvum]|uniref:Mg2+ transporter protein CorA-like/Zinc transport protein ZntB n=1 Tax=Penicillium cf. griseofulvum TaxID=2972120 RepID=A0A9W9ITH6_9EURO|nr:Mg2+ transporter protein CorA-like/Zinc transport protein ZntB [Penicillium cf. griseofulvum]KAJ5430674.1 Mg2+ transporter protein CorA-like/Zinc transport protein ZntB [Penicillium cf. griseofulvum]
MLPSRSSVTSDSHERLEPRLLRAAESNDVDSLKKTIALAQECNQLTDNFLRIGLMRSAERACVAATECLLTLGAKTDVPSNRASPLLRAVERDHYEIVRLLLDHGASPDSADKEGRTALMTAAWKNHADILHLLILRGADACKRDLRRRNVLHNLAADQACRWGWGDEVVRLLLKTKCPLDGDEGRDELGRTPLHWACASGKWRLAEMLLTRTGEGEGDERRPAEVDAVELRGKTALHIATAHDRADIVQLLLAHKAAVNAVSDGKWTPLHNACDKGCEAIVRILISEGAQINAQLLNGITPLHLAAQGGHSEVVKCLLERPDLKRRVRDNFGSTPFLRAAQFKRKDIVLLLAPFNNVESLSDDVQEACAAFDATVVDFGNFHNENRVKRMSVFNLLYGRDQENSRKQAVTTVPADSRATDFRWIHLPANNMAWVEALLTKSFIEEGAHDVDGFKGLEKSFNYQHRGQRTHSHFMRPLCQNTPRTMLRRYEEDTSEEPVSDQGQVKIVDNAARKQKGTGGKPDKADSYFPDEGHGKKGKNNPKRGKSGSAPGTPKQQETKGKSPWGQSEKQARSSPLHPSTFCKDPHPLVSACNVCVFMPYLHFETAERRQQMQDAISRAETLEFVSNGIKRARTRDVLLIDAHLSSSTTSLHVRRTLDQFFYPNIDTKSRDQDQVVYRYQTKSPGMGVEPKIFMVDQLWMWVLGTNLIVTAFPQRWDQPKNDPLNVLDGIIEDINSKTRDPVKSVYDLAMIITNRCSGVFDRHRLGDEEYQFLDMFESSIGIATDKETVLFNQFNHASGQASDWLKSHRKLNGSFSSPPKSGGIDDDQSSKYCDEDGQPLFVDRLLDIGQETNLLAETKDIRDELNMIRTVLEHQNNVLLDFQEVICETYQGQHRSQFEVKKRFKDQQRMIDMHLKDIDRMDKQAERIYHSITDLLDLKQKHANAFEARFARDQAAGTARQGKTIMVFTIVTIVFLPLSFIASVFTINLKEFENLSLGYVSKYTFGIGFAISIPLIWLALTVDDIGGFFRVGSRRWRSSREKVLAKSERGDETLQALEMEKMISLSRMRRSIDAGYGGNLLPVSSRGTGTSRRPDLYVRGLGNGSVRKSYDLRSSQDYRSR